MASITALVITRKSIVNRVYILDYIKSHIDSIFRMLKVEKLEFITNKNKPIVIKNDGLIVGVVCPIVMK